MFGKNGKSICSAPVLRHQEVFWIEGLTVPEASYSLSAVVFLSSPLWSLSTSLKCLTLVKVSCGPHCQYSCEQNWGSITA